MQVAVICLVFASPQVFFFILMWLYISFNVVQSQRLDDILAHLFSTCRGDYVSD